MVLVISLYRLATVLTFSPSINVSASIRAGSAVRQKLARLSVKGW